MKPSSWSAPPPMIVSSAILFHCSTVLPGGRATTAARPADVAGRSRPAFATGTANATATRTIASSRAYLGVVDPCLRMSSPRLLVSDAARNRERDVPLLEELGLCSPCSRLLL